MDWGFSCSTSQSGTDKYSVCTTTCGDSKKASTEQCDNGNQTGCLQNCQPDYGFTCLIDPTAPANQPFSLCKSKCGDSKLASDEVCDNGNAAGCQLNCVQDYGYYCTAQVNGADTSSVCNTVCGDNKLAGTEQCDNGNKTGCLTNCQPDHGYYCNIDPSSPVGQPYSSC